MLRSAAVVVSVAEWLQLLSPAEVAQYYFTGYDSLLSNLAIMQLRDADFPCTEEQADTPIVANLRIAMAQQYPGSTVAIRNERNKLNLALTVPGGAADTWPAQIPQPGPITYPTVGVLPHEVK
jgi:hypothetical protein